QGPTGAPEIPDLPVHGPHTRSDLDPDRAGYRRRPQPRPERRLPVLPGASEHGHEHLRQDARGADRKHQEVLPERVLTMPTSASSLAVLGRDRWPDPGDFAGPPSAADIARWDEA